MRLVRRNIRTVSSLVGIRNPMTDGPSVEELNSERAAWQRNVHAKYDRCADCDLPVQYPRLYQTRPYHSWCLSNLLLKSKNDPSSGFNERALPGWSNVAICEKCGQACPDGVFFKGQPRHRRCAY